MKKLIPLFVIIVLGLTLISLIEAVNVRAGGSSVYTSDSKPLLFACPDYIMVFNSNGISNLESVNLRFSGLNNLNTSEIIQCNNFINNELDTKCFFKEYKSEITSFNNITMAYYKCNLPLFNKKVPNQRLVFSAKDNNGLIGTYELKATICIKDSECDDNNQYTSDTCINPGTFESYCESYSEPSIKLINNITLREKSNYSTNMIIEGHTMPYQFVEGNGSIIDPNKRIVFDDEGNPYGSYLYEGEQIIFDVQVSLGNYSINKVLDFYITTGNQRYYGEGDLAAHCRIKDFRDVEDGVFNLSCMYTVQSESNVRGLYVVEAAFSIINDDESLIHYSIPIGNFFFNPSSEDIQSSKPLIFKCGNTSYMDDPTEHGINGLSLSERKYKSLFEGESINWKVLVADFNGIDKIEDNQFHDGYAVYATVGNENIAGNQIEVECRKSNEDTLRDDCNLREYNNEITEFDPSIMKYFNCRLTCETPGSMYGKKWITVEAKDIYGDLGMMPEAEQWFFNPVIALSINDSVNFQRLKPGQTTYSNEIEIQNKADEGSGVILDMFISGTDFYSNDENSYCPDKQKLPLDRFKYYAINNNFTTENSLDADPEGYLSIPTSVEISQSKRIIRDKTCLDNYSFGYIANLPRGSAPQSTVTDADWYCGNGIDALSTMKLKFKINAPEQCSGEFNSGNIYVWAEAI